MMKQTGENLFMIGYTGNGVAFLFNSTDYEKVASRKWYLSKRGYITTKIARRNVPLHKILIPVDSGYDIDHISGDRLDNRRSNLRVCTHQQNCFNQKKRTTNTSGYVGVCRKKGTAKYEAYIHHHARKIYLGLFDSPEEAARARDKAAIEHFGMFARLNFLRPGLQVYV